MTNKAPRAYESGSGTGFSLGPEQNVFTGVDLAAAEAARDAYATANPAWLAAYDSDKSQNIRLEYEEAGNPAVVHQVRNAVSSWSDNSSAVGIKGDPGPGAQDALGVLHGIYDAGNEALITVNADPTKYDIAAFDYYINGTKYSFPGETGRASGFASGSNFMIVNVDATGIVERPKDSFNTPDTLLNALELGGLGTDDGITIGFLGQSHFDRDTLDRDTYRWAKFAKGADYIGTAASVSESSTALQLDIAGGQIVDPDMKLETVAAENDFGAKPYHHVGGVWDFQPTMTPIVVSDALYDNGTGLTALPNNKWASHTILRSSRTSTIYYVPSQAVYSSEADAIDAPVSLGGFEGQIGTDVSPIAKVIVKEGSGEIAQVVDVRNQATNTVSASTSTLQTTYDRSLPYAEIETTVAGGALTVKGGTGSDTDNVYEGKNNAGDVTFSVQANGTVTVGGGKGLVVSSPNGTKYMILVDNDGNLTTTEV